MEDTKQIIREAAKAKKQQYIEEKKARLSSDVAFLRATEIMAVISPFMLLYLVWDKLQGAENPMVLALTITFLGIPLALYEIDYLNKAIAIYRKRRLRRIYKAARKKYDVIICGDPDLKEEEK